MNSFWRKLLFCMTLAVVCGGCVAAVVGAGAGVGGYSYVKGELKSTYDMPIKALWPQTVSALNSLDLTVGSKNVDALGGKIEVPTIDGGRARVNVDAGAQTGQQFRLRGKGMNSLHGKSRGDMYIQVQVETPVNLTKRQRELLEEFEAEGKGRETHPESEGFFSKVKEFWEDLTE